MLNIDNIVMSSILLLFPLTVYFLYITYVKNMDLKEEDYILDIALISSLFILIRYGLIEEKYISILSSATLIIAYLKKHTKTAILISIILILYYNIHLNINIYLLLIEYILYFLVYKLSKNNKNMINGLVSIKSFFNAYYIYTTINPSSNFLNNLLTALIPTILLITFTSLIIYIYKKSEEITNLNILLKETKKEQELYKSLSKLTHELKNPITVCKGYLEMLDKNNNKNVNKYLPIISSEVERALEVINDFSSLSKLKTITKEEVDLYLLLEETTEMLTPLFRKNKDTLILNTNEDELYISLDYTKMKQVLINIIKNSLEAKKEKETIKVEISVKKFTNWVKIIIKDNGIGMSKDTLEKIYQMFYTTKNNGNGLGAVLCKEIVSLHNGELNYKSALGKGTTVTIKLPL